MRKHMKRQLREILLLMLCIVLVVPAMNMNVSAATQRQKAISAYKSFLSKSKVYLMSDGTSYPDYYSGKRYTYRGTPKADVKFCIAKIDNDNIPELVVSTTVGVGEKIYSVFTYKNGKLQRVICRIDAAFIGYYSKTGIYFERSFTDGTPYYESYYRLKGLKAAEAIHKFSYGRRIPGDETF